LPARATNANPPYSKEGINTRGRDKSSQTPAGSVLDSDESLSSSDWLLANEVADATTFLASLEALASFAPLCFPCVSESMSASESRPNSTSLESLAPLPIRPSYVDATAALARDPDFCDTCAYEYDEGGILVLEDAISIDIVLSESLASWRLHVPPIPPNS